MVSVIRSIKPAWDGSGCAGLRAEVDGGRGQRLQAGHTGIRKVVSKLVLGAAETLVVQGCSGGVRWVGAFQEAGLWGQGGRAEAGGGSHPLCQAPCCQQWSNNSLSQGQGASQKPWPPCSPSHLGLALELLNFQSRSQPPSDQPAWLRTRMEPHWVPGGALSKHFTLPLPRQICKTSLHTAHPCSTQGGCKLREGQQLTRGHRARSGRGRIWARSV